MTISGDTSNVSYELDVLVPTDESDAITIELQQSSDGGVTWETYETYDGSGGTIQKGPNKGQQGTDVITGSLSVSDGDLLQLVVDSITGADAWNVTFSVTQ